MSFDFSPSKFRASSDAADPSDIQAYQRSFTNAMKKFSPVKSKRTGFVERDRRISEDKTPEITNPGHNVVGKSTTFVRDTYAAIKDKTASEYPKVNSVVVSSEALVVKSFIWTLGFLSSEQRKALESVEWGSEIAKLDEKLNPLIGKAVEDGGSALEGAKQSAAVVYKVKPYIDSIAKFLPVEQAQQLTKWAMLFAIKNAKVLVSIVANKKKEEATPE